MLSLAEGHYGKRFCITSDNLYSSLEILLALYKSNADDYGTLRKNKDLPLILSLCKPKKVRVEPLRNFIDQRFMIVRQNDAYKTKFSKIISMISIKHDDQLVNTGKIHYQSKADVRKPCLIINMGRTDNLSRAITPCKIQRKDGNKWYKKTGKLFVEIEIYNAFVFQKSHLITQLKFRQKLIRPLLMQHLHGAPAL